MPGQKDLFGRELKITRKAVADNLVSAAQIVMGEGDEGIPSGDNKRLWRSHPGRLARDPHHSALGVHVYRRPWDRPPTICWRIRSTDRERCSGYGQGLCSILLLQGWCSLSLKGKYIFGRKY